MLARLTSCGLARLDIGRLGRVATMGIVGVVGPAIGARVVGVVRRRCVGSGAVWGWNVGQGAEQEAEEDLCSDQVDAAACAGGLHSLRKSGYPGHCCSRADARQARPGQRRGAVRVRVKADLGPPLGVLAAAFGALGVSGDHRAPQCCPELAYGLVSCGGQHSGFHGAGSVLVQNRGDLGNQPGPSQVDIPGPERRAGRWEPPSQRDRKVAPPRRGGLGHCERQGHLSARVVGQLSRAAVRVDANSCVGVR
jgi:hypothetical protein